MGSRTHQRPLRYGLSNGLINNGVPEDNNSDMDDGIENTGVDTDESVGNTGVDRMGLRMHLPT